MINITAVIKANNDAAILNQLKSLFTTLIKATRLESGCIRYDLHQVKDYPDTFIMMEEWESEEAIERHNGAEHFQQFVAKAKPLLAAPLTIYISNKVI